MGTKIRFELMSNAQLQQHIRLLAQDSHRVLISDHAAQRMQERQVSDYQVIVALDEAEPDIVVITDRAKKVILSEKLASLQSLWLG